MSGLSRYERELRRRLRDSESWPAFDQPDFLNRLDQVAQRALEKRTVEGYLAAILIFHQLVEEMLKLLIQDGQFFVQVAVGGRRIEFAIRRKQTFGQLQQALRESVDFEGKDRFLAVADRINAIRIEVVHRLPTRGSLSGLRRESVAAKRLYEKAFIIFDAAHDDFRVDFHSFKKDLI